jgi:hypothetical protein
MLRGTNSPFPSSSNIPGIRNHHGCHPREVVPNFVSSVFTSGHYFPPLGYGITSFLLSQLSSFGASQFKTPATTRRVNFGASPQSPAHKALHTTAFGLSYVDSPRFFPSWDLTPEPIPSHNLHPTSKPTPVAPPLPSHSCPIYPREAPPPPTSSICHDTLAED